MRYGAVLALWLPPCIFRNSDRLSGCGYFRSHQRHVLKVVRQSRMGVRIFQRTHRHNQRGERFHRLRIGNQQYGHPVIKTNRLILTGVLIALTDCFLDRLPTGIGLCDGSPKGDKQNKRFEQGAAALRPLYHGYIINNVRAGHASISFFGYISP